MFFANSAFGVEFQPLELPKKQQNEEIKAVNEVKEVKEVKEVNEKKAEDLEAPKGLLHDEDYKFKGRVEYDEKGVLFLDEDDVSKLDIAVKTPKKQEKKSVFYDSELLSKIEEQRRIKVPVVDEYLASSFFGSAEYKAGKNFTYGTTFGTDLDIAQVEYRTKLFAKYDNRFMSFMTAVGKDEYTSSGRQMSSIYFVPELKLGHGISILDAFKANPEYDRFRNEVIVKYSPKIKQSRENLQLEAGLSQTSYYKSGDMIYQFSVSTKYRF